MKLLNELNSLLVEPIVPKYKSICPGVKVNGITIHSDPSAPVNEFRIQPYGYECSGCDAGKPIVASDEQWLVERRRAVSAEDDVRKLEDMLSAIAELARRGLLSRPGDPPLSTIASICRAAGIEPKKRC